MLNKKELLGSKETWLLPRTIRSRAYFKKFKNLFCFKKGKIKQVFHGPLIYCWYCNIYAMRYYFFHYSSKQKQKK
jgi:hypothetical protein